jgi:hypothetical protein
MQLACGFVEFIEFVGFIEFVMLGSKTMDAITQ